MVIPGRYVCRRGSKFDSAKAIAIDNFINSGGNKYAVLETSFMEEMWFVVVAYAELSTEEKISCKWTTDRYNVQKAHNRGRRMTPISPTQLKLEAIKELTQVLKLAQEERERKERGVEKVVEIQDKPVVKTEAEIIMQKYVDNKLSAEEEWDKFEAEEKEEVADMTDEEREQYEYIVQDIMNPIMRKIKRDSIFEARRIRRMQERREQDSAAGIVPEI